MNNTDHLLILSILSPFYIGRIMADYIVYSCLGLYSATQAGLAATGRQLSSNVVMFTLICSWIRLPAFSTSPEHKQQKNLIF
jgi:hypothetical protein